MPEEKIEQMDDGQQVAGNLLCLTILIANVCLIGKPDSKDSEWVLVDAGLNNTGGRIIRTAKNRFGENCKLKAIILTYGHFDHVGATQEILNKYDIPVYAHELEIPYLNGKSELMYLLRKRKSMDLLLILQLTGIKTWNRLNFLHH